MEPHDGGPLDDNGGALQVVRAQEDGEHRGDASVQRTEIWRPLPTAIQHDQLLLEQRGLGNDRAGAAGQAEPAIVTIS